jgi:CTP synthase (UTP-ammonia lyase)
MRCKESYKFKHSKNDLKQRHTSLSKVLVAICEEKPLDNATLDKIVFVNRIPREKVISTVNRLRLYDARIRFSEEITGEYGECI